MKMDVGAKLSAYGDRESWQQVKVGDFLVSASQDEQLGIQLLLVDPKREDFSMEGIFTFDSSNSSLSGVPLYSGMLGGIYKVNDDSVQANSGFCTELVDKFLMDVVQVVETEHALSEESVLVRNPSNPDISGSPPVLGSSEGLSLARAVAEAECCTNTVSSSRTGIRSRKTQKSKKKNAGSGKHLSKEWSSTEVAKLIEGIAKIGTGRWTPIKNVMFSSDPHRTPDNLRRKWASLVRASRAQDPDKQDNVGEQGTKRAIGKSSILPKNLVRQVLELASIERSRKRST